MLYAGGLCVPVFASRQSSLRARRDDTWRSICLVRQKRASMRVRLTRRLTGEREDDAMFLDQKQAAYALPSLSRELSLMEYLLNPVLSFPLRVSELKGKVFAGSGERDTRVESREKARGKEREGKGRGGGGGGGTEGADSLYELVDKLEAEGLIKLDPSSGCSLFEELVTCQITWVDSENVGALLGYLKEQHRGGGGVMSPSLTPSSQPSRGASGRGVKRGRDEGHASDGALGELPASKRPRRRDNNDGCSESREGTAAPRQDAADGSTQSSGGRKREATDSSAFKTSSSRKSEDREGARDRREEQLSPPSGGGRKRQGVYDGGREGDTTATTKGAASNRRTGRREEEGDGSRRSKKQTKSIEEELEELLNASSVREKENLRQGTEILELLNTKSVLEKAKLERFQSIGGPQLKEFCPHKTREECRRVRGAGNRLCGKLHFRKIIKAHTDENLGDCSFLNTCFHMDTCKFVHYTIDSESMGSITTNTTNTNTSNAASSSSLLLRHSSGGAGGGASGVGGGSSLGNTGSNSASLSSSKLLRPTLLPGSAVVDDPHRLMPPQWINCDLRAFDMRTLGKFSVIMADPPWDIHMELPYGTMSDDEMRNLSIPTLQDEGYIFLWVTGRAMELGRECLTLWGYERVDELVWVKTNQLQRLIRTGRTGHWINHGKEHCLVGVKGNPQGYNKGIDCDVIVAEVRATSHKPDEVYGLIERLSPGTMKIELFGRQHNCQPNWLNLGNQLDGVQLIDPDLMEAFYARYPSGNAMAPSMPPPTHAGFR